MKSKRLSLGNRYKRFFLDERTALIAALVSILILPVNYYFGVRSGGIDVVGLYDLLMRLVLVCTLLYSLKTHKLLLMQAATVGLLFCMLCAQSQYSLGKLARQDSETYITMGLQGFIFLAGERMILFIQSFVCVSHFVIHAIRRQEAIRVSINQVSLLFLLTLLIVQLMIAPSLSFERDYILYIWTLHLDELFIFILVACAELQMSKNKHWAIWYLFTTMLSIFSICTIRIFDGFNWPFYAVTVNALISLGGLVFHIHMEEHARKSPGIGFSLFILSSQYHNPLEPDGTFSSSLTIDHQLAESGKDVLLLETDDLYIYYADYRDLSLAAGKRPSKRDQSIQICVAAAFQSSYQLGFSHDNIVGWHTSEGQLERGKPQENLGVSGTPKKRKKRFATPPLRAGWDFSSSLSSATGSGAAMAAMSSGAIVCLRSSMEKHASLIPAPKCITTTLSAPFRIWASGTRCTAIWEADGTIPGIGEKTGNPLISSAFHGRSLTTGSYSENNSLRPIAEGGSMTA